MKINADLSLPVHVDTTALDWVPSPSPGVDRRMLDRDGDEVARATSVVRYAPGSEFPTHTHGGGEEFLVLDGVFSDEHGDFPAGTYVRNPVGSSHAPRTGPGCTILVKLRQMDPADQTQVTVDTNGGDWVEGDVPGLFRMPLHEFGTERVWLTKMGAGCAARPKVGRASRRSMDCIAPTSWSRALPPAAAKIQRRPRWASRGAPHAAARRS